MYIEKIKINNYKNYYDSEIELNKGINIIIGQNNIGKSNLLKVVQFLNNDPNKDSGGIDNFNKHNLFLNYKKYLKTAPTIEIIYTIKHHIKANDEDTIHGFSKIIQMIVYGNQGELEEMVEDTFECTAVLKLKYELDPQYYDEYKKLMNDVKDYYEFNTVLKRFEKRYMWKYYTLNGVDISRSIVNTIFSLQFVEATRVIEEVSTIAKKNVSKKLREHKIEEEDVRREVTKLFNDNWGNVIDDINKEIEEDQEKIGISDGNNKFISTFDFRGHIEDSFKYELKNDDETAPYILPLENNGLGYNNLIYIRNLIRNEVDENREKSEYNMLLLEEPEAHLHPNMQYKLISYIRALVDDNDEKQQIIITTHSPNISASAKLDELILLFAGNTEILNINSIKMRELFNIEQYEKFQLQNDDKKEMKTLLGRSCSHLFKFLDVTRSDILFSTKIILVEGVAEKLLIPKFFPKLENYHVVIVELGGINFNHFLPLAVNTNKKVLCITDLDFDYYEKNGNGEDKAVAYKDYSKKQKENISSIFIKMIEDKSLKTLNTATQKKYGNTFETELLVENYDDSDAWGIIIESTEMPNELKVVCKEKSYNKCKETIAKDNKQIKESTKGVVRKYVNIFKEIIASASSVDQKIYEKLLLVNIVYHYIKNQKGEFALSLLNHPKFDKIKIPQYIKDGVEWLLKKD